jgi:hypothetical protein
MMQDKFKRKASLKEEELHQKNKIDLLFQVQTLTLRLMNGKKG